MPKRSSPAARDPLIALRIPQDLDDQLRARVEQDGESISAFVRRLIEQALPTTQTRSKPPSEAEDKILPRAPRRARAATRGRPAATCEHRVRPGSFCSKCDAIVRL